MTLGELFFFKEDTPYLWEYNGMKKLVGITKIHCDIAISVYVWGQKSLCWSTTCECIKREANLKERLQYPEGYIV